MQPLKGQSSSILGQLTLPGTQPMAHRGAVEGQHSPSSAAGAHRLPNLLSLGGLSLGFPAPLPWQGELGHTQPERQPTVERAGVPPPKPHPTSPGPHIQAQRYLHSPALGHVWGCHQSGGL